MVKTITIRDEVYQKLIKLKRNDESFSQLFDRLSECRDSRQALIQLRDSVELTGDETKQMLAEIKEKRAERRI